MDERVVQFRVGVMVLATIIITGILILLFNEFPSMGAGTYTIHVRFSSAPGVAKDTPVRRSGILIGRVTDVEFDEKYNVIATLEINRDHTIFESDEIRITRSLLGDAELEVVRRVNLEPSGEPRSTAKPVTPAADGTPIDSEARGRRRGPFLLAVLQPKAKQQEPVIREAQPMPPPRRAADVPVPEGATIEGRVTTTPLESFEDLKDDFARAADALTIAGGEVGGLARNLNSLVERNSEQFDRIVNRADVAMLSFQRAMESINDVMGDPEVRANLKQALKDLPSLLQETQRSIASIEGAMRLVDSNLRNLEGFTGPLGERGESIVANVDSSIARLNDLLGQVEEFSRSLNSQEGTLGQLVRNPAIYQQLNEAAQNVNELTEMIRPILADARIFSDKIARHPGVIVRDAVKPGSGTKWVTPPK
jgi:phospholipid/cholesterol/gamma-HCH transport system substrate-binding protein